MSIGSFPAADFTPQLVGYTGQGAFRFWCQKVLPIVYDDSLSYYELLNRVVVYLNNVIKDVSATIANVDSIAKAFNELQSYVNNYFDSLDVQEEINNKLDELNQNNELAKSVARFLASALGTTNPESFGAVGDGVTDDTTAIQDAIDSGAKVVFGYKKNYFISHPIDVSDSAVDFNYSIISHSSNVAIKTKPVFKKVTSLLTTVNNSSYVTVSDGSGIDNGDMLIIVDKNTKFNAARRYYVNGGIFHVKRVDGTKVYITPHIEFNQYQNSVVIVVKPTTTIIKNVGGITPSGASPVCYGINLIGCANAVVDGLYGGTNHSGYLCVGYCFNTLISNADFKPDENVVAHGDIYGIILGPSSITRMNNLYIENPWHCVTTGGAVTADDSEAGDYLFGLLTAEYTNNIPCQYIYLDDSVLISSKVWSGAASLDEHGNAYKTYIRDCVIDGMNICNGGVIDNVECNLDEGLASIYIDGSTREDIRPDLTIRNCKTNFDALIYREVSHDYTNTDESYFDSWFMYLGNIYFDNCQLRDFYPVRARGYVSRNGQWVVAARHANTRIKSLNFSNMALSSFRLLYTADSNFDSLYIDEINFEHCDITCLPIADRYWYGNIGEIRFYKCRFSSDGIGKYLFALSRAISCGSTVFEGCSDNGVDYQYQVYGVTIVVSNSQLNLIVFVTSNADIPVTVNCVNSKVIIYRDFLGRTKQNAIFNCFNSHIKNSITGNDLGNIVTDLTTFDKYSAVFNGETYEYTLLTEES